MSMVAWFLLTVYDKAPVCMAKPERVHFVEDTKGVTGHSFDTKITGATLSSQPPQRKCCQRGLEGQRWERKKEGHGIPQGGSLSHLDVSIVILQQNTGDPEGRAVFSSVSESGDASAASEHAGLPPWFQWARL